MRNIESSLVFCDVAMLMANIKLSYRPLNYLAPNTQDFRHQVIWCKQVSAMWVMVPVPFMDKGWLCFCTWSCFFQQYSPEWENLYEAHPGWSIAEPEGASVYWSSCQTLIDGGSALGIYHWGIDCARGERPGAETASGASGRQTGEGKAGSGDWVSRRPRFEQKLFKSLTNPELNSSKIDMSLLPKFCCAGSEQIAYTSEIHQACSFCVLIHFFHAATWTVLEIFLTMRYIISSEERSWFSIALYFLWLSIFKILPNQAFYR